MAKLYIVMGANATGKTYFIKKHWGKDNYEILNVYDYQQRAYEPYGEYISFETQFACLYEANEKLLEDTIVCLKKGKDVVIEQTFFKTKRRVAFVDAIRNSVDARIILYFMNPYENEWEKYIRKREMSVEATMRDKEEIEFPNIAEGYDELYEVSEGITQAIMRAATPENVEQARQDLEDERKRIAEKEKARKEREEFVESFKRRPFWHYCEVCGKKEWLTAEDAYKVGWDYPPKMGVFGLLSPRKCGECGIDKTLYWKSVTEKERFPWGMIVKSALTEDELTVWERIVKEPRSLL